MRIRWPTWRARLVDVEFFRRKAGSNDAYSGPGFPSSGHAADDALLGQLASRSDLASPRHWVHYLYFANEAAARSAAEVVSSAGWQIQRVDESANGGPEWVVIVEAQAVTSPTAVAEARMFFEGVAATHEGGDYDGWEASLWDASFGHVSWIVAPIAHHRCEHWPMIESADEFVRLRTSQDRAEYHRAAHDEATEATWIEVLERFPDMRVWVAHNKTVPLTILERLRHDSDVQGAAERICDI